MLKLFQRAKRKKAKLRRAKTQISTNESRENACIFFTECRRGMSVGCLWPLRAANVVCDKGSLSFPEECCLQPLEIQFYIDHFWTEILLIKRTNHMTIHHLFEPFLYLCKVEEKAIACEFAGYCNIYSINYSHSTFHTVP